MPDDTTDSDLFETATVLAENIPEDAFDGVRATLEYLHYRDDEAIDEDDLRAHAPCALTRRQAEDIVLQLRVESILTATDHRPGVLRSVFDAAAMLAQRDVPPENPLVATIPYDDPALDPTMFEPLLSNTVELVKSAEESLTLISPFLSEEAFDQLRPALRTAVGNGADVTLVTRYLTYRDDKRWNREFADALLTDDVLGESVRCYEYINDETFTTFHAKIVVADGQRAYLGTANLTHRGLGDNLELGVMFHDETAARLAGLVEALRESQFLHETERVENEIFRRL